MLEKILSKVLTQYKIHIQTGKQFRSQKEIDILKKQIDVCEYYLNNGSKANGTWMEENHRILYRAIKCSYDNYRDSFDGEEYHTLNNCVKFYKKLYAQWKLDFDSVIF